MVEGSVRCSDGFILMPSRQSSPLRILGRPSAPMWVMENALLVTGCSCGPGRRLWVCRYWVAATVCCRIEVL